MTKEEYLEHVKDNELRNREPDIYDIEDAWIAGYNHATTNRRDLIEPIPLSSEILEKNGFKKDAFTNLSPDYCFDDENCSIAINLCSTCSKQKSIWVENKKSKISVTIEESRTSMDKKPLYVHQLQQALEICGIKKTIDYEICY